MIDAMRWTVVALATVLAGGLAQAQTTERVSVDSSGAQGLGESLDGSISADGRFVAFDSSASNLVPGDTNGCVDVFVRDRLLGTTERVSVASSGAQGDWHSTLPVISADGRYVAFRSSATNLVPGVNGPGQLYVHDRQSGTTEKVSVSSSGVQGDSGSLLQSISADGRFVTFSSSSTNLVVGDTNGSWDAFVRDRQNGTTERVSLGSGGVQGRDDSFAGGISTDGRFVAFSSFSSDLVAGDTNGMFDVFVRDRQNGTTERVSLGSGGVQGDGNSFAFSVSADGRFVLLQSLATNLVAGDNNASLDFFVRDRQSGTTERVSVGSGGAEANFGAADRADMSADGRFVAFESPSTNLSSGDTNGYWDIFVHDRATDATEWVSVDPSGAQGNDISRAPSISADGRFVAFDSESINLVAGDTNGVSDVFVRDSGPVIPGTDLCQPGTGSVIACPCSNPPSGAPRGCDNSAGTGGAQLASSGWASLAFESVVFTTNGERPTAASILLQGNAESQSGIAFGQGVRCVTGLMKRLYLKIAASGSITVPGPGDLPVSARSAALGDPISAGASRWYAVYYRDPILLGGCPAASGFNITQTQLVAWGP